MLRVATVALAMTAMTADASGLAPEHRTEVGRRVYADHCAACHGSRAQGQPKWERPNTLGELPAPPHDKHGHTWKHADGMLYRIVSEGWRDPFNKTQRLTMPAYRESLKPAEIQAVIDYLKTLWTPQQRAFQVRESQKDPYPAEPGR